MNETNHKEVSHKDAAVCTDIVRQENDVRQSTPSTSPPPHLSESSLDVFIPSYPGSPRSISVLPSESAISLREKSLELQKAVEYLQTDYPLLDAAEVGNYKRIEELLRIKSTNVDQRDLLGRTALHLAVFAGSVRSIKLLLDAGIIPDVKDDLGMTPLSICLLRNPSVAIANLLFDRGAVLLPRDPILNPMDTGLFTQFVSLCAPTYEDEKLLEILVQKGALINDPHAPGGRQPLHIAAMGNNCRLIRKLIELGAKPNMKNHRGETPKTYAKIFKCKEAYELLDEYDDNESLLSSITNTTRSLVSIATQSEPSQSQRLESVHALRPSLQPKKVSIYTDEDSPKK